jgi:hypothetical protein
VSFKVTNWVWENSQSRNGARLVMLAIADRADENGFAWPSIEDIAARTLLSPRAVQKGIANLIEIGELEVGLGGGRHRRNRYQIIPKPRQIDGVTAQKPRTSDGVSQRETPHSATETPNFEHETPNFATRNPVQSSPESSLEPSEEPSGNQSLTRANVPVLRDPDDDFPIWCIELADAVSGAGINVPWRFQGDDAIRVHNDIKRLGVPLMVSLAIGVMQNLKGHAVSSRLFYDTWHRTRTPAPAQPGAAIVPLHATDPKAAARNAARAGYDAIANEIAAQAIETGETA